MSTDTLDEVITYLVKAQINIGEAIAQSSTEYLWGQSLAVDETLDFIRTLKEEQ